jgi:hypothetical protein
MLENKKRAVERQGHWHQPLKQQISWSPEGHGKHALTLLQTDEGAKEGLSESLVCYGRGYEK